MAVNTKTWQRFPIADRDQSFNADHAIKRIQQVSAGSVETFNMAFLWRDSNGPPNNKNSYRLPIADIINGRFVLIPHAVFTAAAILSGAHGGLEGVVGEDEKKQLRDVVTRIYAKLRDLFSDGRIIPPWERNDIPPDQRPNRQISTTASGSVNGELANLPVAQQAYWSDKDSRDRLWQWADGDFRRYRQGFAWWDALDPARRNAYRMPLVDVHDGRLMLVPQAVHRLAGQLSVKAANVPDAALPQLKTVVAALVARVQEGEQEVTETLLRPPAHWFDDPQLPGPTPLSVTADGRVSGHLALWNVCHFGVRDQCRMAPHSATGYKYFTTGEVLTADGSSRRVGRITQGTGHAHLSLGYIPAADHYDDTGSQVAVVAAGEDGHGIWVAGSLLPGVSEHRVAELRRSPLSGDWRPTSQGLELVAALAVNSPGFPVVGFTASGEVQSLVAAGMVLSDDDVSALQAQQPQEPAVVADDTVVQERLVRLERFQRKAHKMTRDARTVRLDAILRRMGGV